MLSYIKLFLIIIHTIIHSVLALLFAVLDRSYHLYFKLSKSFSWGVLFLGGVKLKITGMENIEKGKPYIFVSNHSSQFDIPTLQLAFPNETSIVYKKELGKIPLFGWQMKLGPYVMIDRDNRESAARSIENARKIMAEKGRSILLFAEGTRSKTGEVQPFKRGAFYLAVKAGYPIVPVSISGAEKILPKGKFAIKGGTITVHFDKPITTDNIQTKKDELELMERVRQIIIAHRNTESIS
ncbi:MAG: lysophospholipid acyltransferase family protein [Ignavibacteriaceae bacterium]|nr:lysophospholipid acyltransferase family protein [Ignavibacteriaceae bacterium]